MELHGVRVASDDEAAINARRAELSRADLGDATRSELRAKLLGFGECYQFAALG